MLLPGSRYVSNLSCSQILRLPESLDEYVGPGNPVRLPIMTIREVVKDMRAPSVEHARQRRVAFRRTTAK
jgi:hypothetical protein